MLITCSATVYKAQDTPLTEDSPLQPQSPYATSKLAQELLAAHVHRDEGLPIVIARSFNHTGPGQDHSYVASGIARQIACIEAGQQEPALRMGNLDPQRDLSDVRDVVRAYEAMIERATPGRPYNVCSGRAMSIKIAGRDIRHAGARDGRRGAGSGSLPSGRRASAGRQPRSTDERNRLAATIPLKQTVDDLLAYWRGRIHHHSR